ncbi:MAG TPA: ATPase [Planctomycetaceae bacterium]|nr:ATPase [Planctomycetaceae bacterium]
MSGTEHESDTICTIAVPVSGGRLSDHFGHCEWFTLFEVDRANRRIITSRQLEPPPHQPGLLPAWLQRQGVNLVIAGGMGQRALGIFAQQGIQVITGAAPGHPEAIVCDWLEGRLQQGPNVCEH